MNEVELRLLPMKCVCVVSYHVCILRRFIHSAVVFFVSLSQKESTID